MGWLLFELKDKAHHEGCTGELMGRFSFYYLIYSQDFEDTSLREIQQLSISALQAFVCNHLKNFGNCLFNSYECVIRLCSLYWPLMTQDDSHTLHRSLSMQEFMFSYTHNLFLNLIILIIDFNYRFYIFIYFQAKGKKPMFVQFVLDNIWALYETVLVRRYVFVFI